MRSFAEQRDFKPLLLADPDIAQALSRTEIERAFDLDEQLKHVGHIFERVFHDPFPAGPVHPAESSSSVRAEPAPR
jgi:hypothetical protein